jgi:hypothetical protein
MVEQTCPIIIYMISEVKTCNYGKIKIQHQTTNKDKLTSYKLHQSNILLLFSTVSALFEAPYTVYLPLDRRIMLQHKKTLQSTRF